MKLPPALTTVTPLSKFLALFLFILIPLVGFYAGKEYQKSKTPVALPMVETGLKPVSTITPANDQTENWKTYRNEELGFEFKYPNDFEYYNYDISYDSSWYYPSIILYTSFTPIDYETGHIPPSIILRIFTNNENLSINAWLTKNTGSADLLFEEISKTQYANIASTQAVRFVSEFDVETEYHALFSGKDKILINIFYSNYFPNANLDRIVNHILSTFRFLDDSEIYQTIEDCQEQTGDTCYPADSVMLTGQVLENKEVSTDPQNVNRYLLIRTKDGVERKIIYYDIAPYSACYTENSDIAHSIKVGQTVQAVGDPTDDSHSAIWICNSNHYSIKVLK